MRHFDRAGHRLTRRAFVTRSAQVAGAAVLAASGADTVLAAGRPLATRRQYTGQLVVSTIHSEFSVQTQQVLSKLYAQYQPGVKLVFELPDLAAGPYASWLGTQLAAGSIRPDLVSGVDQKAYQGYVDFAEYRYTTNPYTGHLWNDDLAWDKAQGYDLRGHIIGVPTGAYSIVWFYNKALFAKAGVVPPTNWDELVAACAKLQAAGITPIAANYDWQVPQWLTEIYSDQYLIDWVNVVRAQPGDWNYNPERDGKFVFNPKDQNLHLKYTFNSQRYYRGIRDGKLRFDTPEIAALVQNLARVFPRYATGDFFVIEDPYPTFLQQQAAIMPDSTDFLITLATDMANLTPQHLKALGISSSNVKAFEWGTFLMPPMTGPLVKSPVRSIEGSDASPSIVRKTQQQVDMAVDFMMFFASRVGFQPYIDSQLKSPGFSVDPVTVTGVQLPSSLAQAFKQIHYLGQSEASYNQVFLQWGGDVQRRARDLLKSALQGQTSPTAFASQLQQLVKGNLATILRLAGLTNADLDNPARQPGT